MLTIFLTPSKRLSRGTMHFRSFVFVITLTLRVKYLYSLTCYSCNNIDDPHSCNSTMSCTSTEVCYLNMKEGLYSMGCANNQYCGGVIGPDIVGRDVVNRRSSTCLECCSSDVCNADICKHINPTLCIDDATVDCARMNTLFKICQDLHQASLVCRKFCNLCSLVDGNWAEWTPWSSCDVTCDNGTQTRTRTCTNPAPAYGGLDCVGSSSETKQCIEEACPIHGGWSQWSSWGSCSVSCDIGLERRDRTCSNPYPSRNGDHCFGDGRDDRICMVLACADGAWSNWGSWGSCSESCGGGVKSRLRACTNPRPSILGKGCEGSSEQVVLCNKNTCDDHKVAFLAYGSSTETSFTSLKFPMILWNNGNGYSSGTGRFTCTIPGIYNFAVTLTKPRRDIDVTSGYLRVNSVSRLHLYADPDDHGSTDYGSYSVSVAGNFHLNVFDYVDVQSLPSDLLNDISTSFTGVLIVPDN